VTFLRNILLASVLAGCATTDGDPRDPFEGFNRGVYKFNETVDKAIAKPVATAYRDLLHEEIRSRVRNFFSNIADLFIGVNNLLQGKFQDGVEDWARFAFNSTIGLFGIHDVASDMGIEKHDEDFGQTFGRWGAALFRKARGIDSYEFFIDAEPKSLSHNQTFGTDTNDRELLESTLSYLCQKAAKRLRDAGLHARTVSLTLRYIDFKTITRSQTLGEPSDLDTVFLKSIRELFGRSWNGAAMLRLVGVELSMFSAGPAQLDLLDPGRREKLERLARATDLLRDRFGFSKVQFGGSLNAKEKRD